MAHSEQISVYEVSYYGGGKNDGHYPYRACIKLRRSNNTLIATAYFHRSTDTMPGSDQMDHQEHITCHYRDTDYDHVLDLLRNEKPVFIEYIEGKYHVANICTYYEPVGEGE